MAMGQGNDSVPPMIGAGPEQAGKLAAKVDPRAMSTFITDEDNQAVRLSNIEVRLRNFIDQFIGAEPQDIAAAREDVPPPQVWMDTMRASQNGVLRLIDQLEYQVNRIESVQQ